MLLCSPAGNDLLYEDTLPEQGRNFANKIWNAFRLVKSWEIDDNIAQPESSKIAVEWLDEFIKKAMHDIDQNFKKFRISEALMTTYKLFWDEFSGWYLEIIKPEYQKPVDRATYNSTIAAFEKLMMIIHPFMPFITEEIWQLLAERNKGESIMITRLPEIKKHKKDLIEGFEPVKELISSVRTLRKEKNIPTRERLELMIRAESDNAEIRFLPVVSKLCNLSDISFVTVKPGGAASFMVCTTEYFIPLGGKLDVEAELDKIREELEYNRGFLTAVMKKLENERFVQNAPAHVLELERKKKSDAESKIESLEARIKELKKA